MAADKISAHHEALDMVLEYITENPGSTMMDVYESLEVLSLDRTIELCEELVNEGRVKYVIGA